MDGTSRVLSIFGTKGGVGKTFIATNLAATLRLQFGLKTAIVSLDQAKADASMMLGTTDVYHAAAPLQAATLPSVIAELGRTHRYVLIDAGAVVSELTVSAFEHSNLILLVVTPDLIADRHANRTLEMFESLKLPLGMVRIVINRAESRGNFRSKEVKEQFPTAVIAEIPSDGRLAGLSVNQGVPAITLDEGRRLKDAFAAFAKALMEHPQLFVFVTPLHLNHAARVAAGPSAVPVEWRKEESHASHQPQAEDPLVALKRRVHAKLIERIDLKRLDLNTMNLNNPQMAQQLKARAEKIALELIGEEIGVVPGRDLRMQLVKEVLEEALGLGPIEDLMLDEEVSDILVNGKDDIYIEKHGKLIRTGKRFTSNDHLLMVIERIIAPLGRRVDESNPMVDARLPDGSRVNAIIPPLSIRGPMLSIRRFGRTVYKMEELVKMGTLTEVMAQFLHNCVLAKKNIVISGGAGSGKTTLLNVLSASIPEGERIITIEDAAELRLEQDHWVPLEARPPNIENKGAISIRQIFRNALRMRPDRILIGECRGDETFDMLQAMNTGHQGSLTTLHANSHQDVITRLDSLVLMSNIDLPVRAIREQIASAIDLIVHTARLSDGSRRVLSITEVLGMNDQAVMMFGDLFVFQQRGLSPTGEVIGEFKAAGRLPSFVNELRAKGFQVDEALFLNTDAPPAQITADPKP